MNFVVYKKIYIWILPKNKNAYASKIVENNLNIIKQILIAIF